MTTIKTFFTSVLLTVYTGRGLPHVQFSDMHEAIEHLLGEPVWTHQLASPEPWRRAREAICEQYPKFADVDVAELETLCSTTSGGALNEALDTWLQTELVTLGEMLSIARGQGRDPADAQEAALAEIASLGKPVVSVEVDR